ncbi:MAG: hypothetical protein AAF974_00455 [Cyanobacteria bacterium P01_E01_bin.34]
MTTLVTGCLTRDDTSKVGVHSCSDRQQRAIDVVIATMRWFTHVFLWRGLVHSGCSNLQALGVD